MSLHERLKVVACGVTEIMNPSLTVTLAVFGVSVFGQLEVQQTLM